MHAGGQTISNLIIVPKGITLLAQTATFNKDSIEWRQKPTNLKTWATFKKFSHWAHREQRRAVTTLGKGGYTAAVQKNYSVLPPPPEEHQKAIGNLNNIFQGIQMQSYNLEGLEKSNTFLNICNSVLMAKLAQMTETMNAMQA